MTVGLLWVGTVTTGTGGGRRSPPSHDGLEMGVSCSQGSVRVVIEPQRLETKFPRNREYLLCPNLFTSERLISVHSPCLFMSVRSTVSCTFDSH